MAAMTVSRPLLGFKNTHPRPMFSKASIERLPYSNFPKVHGAQVPSKASWILRAKDKPTAAVSTQLPFLHSSNPSKPSENIVMKAMTCAAWCAICVSALSLFPSAAQAATDAAGGSPLSNIISFILHLDKHLSSMIATHGTATYAILFAIVFAETGLVLTPFLPGDSLLFAAGAFAGMGQLSLPILLLIFNVAAILGDAVNYAVGSKLGTMALEKGIINKDYIRKTEKFYEKYGGKTVVIARFVPIVRTFAPFVAGVGSMPYNKFAMYNVGGALLWSLLFTGAGFFFGNLPFVKHNFTLVVMAIIVVSIVPVVWEIIQARKEAKQEGGSAAA